MEIFTGGPNNRAIYPALVAAIKSSSPEMTNVTLNLFTRICQRHLEGDRSFDLSSSVVTVILQEFGKNLSEDAGNRAELLLQLISKLSGSTELSGIVPTAIHYNCVIKVHGAKGTMSEAEDLFIKMKKLSSEGDEALRPDLRTYTSLFKGYANMSSGDALVRAEKLFEELLERYHQGEVEFKPDEHLLNTMFMILSKAEGDPSVMVRKGFELLGLLSELDVIPNAAMYGVMCRLCLKDGSLEALERMESMIREAEAKAEMELQPKLKRTVYEQAATTYMYSNAPGAKDKAYELIKHLEDSKNSIRPSVRVDRRFLHILLSGWARSGETESVKECVKVVEKLKSMHADGEVDCAPTAKTYNWVLRAIVTAKADSSEEMRKNFEIAMRYFKEAHRSLTCTHVTYATFLEICSKLLPLAARDVIVDRTFQLCAKNGFVSQDVLNRMASISRKFLDDAIAKYSGGDATQQDLPTKWYRNVPEGKIPETAKIEDAGIATGA
jgi:hypothetical protein